MSPVSPFFALAARRRLRLQATVGVAVLALGLTTLSLLPADGGSARAHEGESHGAPVAGAAASTGDTVAVGKAAQFLLNIRTTPAVERDVSAQIRIRGVLAARPQGDALVSAPQPGQIVSRAFPAVGTRVRQGQLLATVEGSLSGPDRAALASTQAQAQAELAQTRLDVDRLKRLSQVVARKEIEAAEIRLHAAETTAKAAARALGSGRRYELRAPIAGTLTQANATLGQQVEPGVTLFRVIDLSRLYVEGQLYETDLGPLTAAGQSVGRSARVAVPAYPDTAFAARLVSIGGIVDATTRTVGVVFEVENRDGWLRAGQQAEVGIEVGRPERAVVVPEAAIVRSGEVPMIFVHTSPEAFVGHRVALGTRTGNEVVVESGVRAGDRIVTVGAYQLRAAR